MISTTQNLPFGFGQRGGFFRLYTTHNEGITLSVIVYSQPNCQPCRATYRALEAAGIEYRVIDVTEDDGALEYVRSLGHQQSPVVVAGDQHWSGFRPDMLSTL